MIVWCISTTDVLIKRLLDSQTDLRASAIKAVVNVINAYPSQVNRELIVAASERMHDTDVCTTLPASILGSVRCRLLTKARATLSSLPSSGGLMM